jgi:hypothetical protein
MVISDNPNYVTILKGIYNGQSSVQKHFGLVHWYYLQGLK